MKTNFILHIQKGKKQDWGFSYLNTHNEPKVQIGFFEILTRARSH